MRQIIESLRRLHQKGIIEEVAKALTIENKVDNE